MRSRSRNSAALWGFLSISLVAHINAVLLIVAVLSVNPDGCSSEDMELRPFEVALVPQAEISAEQKKEELKKIREEEKKKKEEDPKGQVVELPPPLEEKRPDKARFRSEYDSSVKKQTRGPQLPFKPGRLVPRQPVRVPRQPPPTPRELRKLQRKMMKLAMRSKPDPPKSELQKSEKGDQPARVEKQQKVPRGPRSPRTPPAGPRTKKVPLSKLKLSQKELARVLGSRVNDYLKGVDKGKQTLLNSKRWRFASFFNRVKRKVAQNWHPAVVYRRRDPKGNVYGFKDRLTILRVRLTPQGKLKDLHLENASGVGFLDDEAMSAFRAAEPFPNPPKGLVDKQTGLISFRFGFLFEISRRPSFRILRSSP